MKSRLLSLACIASFSFCTASPPAQAGDGAITEIEALSLYVERGAKVTRLACKELAVNHIALDAWFEGVKRDTGTDVREWIDVSPHQKIVLAIGQDLENKMIFDLSRIDGAREFCANVYLDMGPQGRIAPGVLSLVE